MRITTRLQLSAMMFMEFFIWGGWFVTLGTFLNNNLHASGSETGSVFSTQSWGAIIAPFIIGLIADRYFNAEKILGCIAHLRGNTDVPNVQRHRYYCLLSLCTRLHGGVYAHPGVS